MLRLPPPASCTPRAKETFSCVLEGLGGGWQEAMADLETRADLTA